MIIDVIFISANQVLHLQAQYNHYQLVLHTFNLYIKMAQNSCVTDGKELLFILKHFHCAKSDDEFHLNTNHNKLHALPVFKI